MVVLYAPIARCRVDTSQVRSSHSLARTSAVFDDLNLVSHGGLVPVMALAERAGLPELLAEHVRPAERLSGRQQATHGDASLVPSKQRIACSNLALGSFAEYDGGRMATGRGG
jgi:hypothetical protein